MKPDLKNLAIDLRKHGLTYSEIMAKVPVAKSTLSLWLQSVSLAKHQQQRITEKKRLSQQKAAVAKHQQRLDLTKKIGKEALKEMRRLDDTHLWLAGIILYWAEGTKQKEHIVSQQVNFNNSDPRMIQLFLRWLLKVMKIPRADISFEIYIHTTANIEKSLIYWSKVVSCDKGEIKVYFKRHNPKTNRKNTGISYNGLLRVRVRKSTNLNRKIAAWVNHICNYWGVVQW